MFDMTLITIEYTKTIENTIELLFVTGVILQRSQSRNESESEYIKTYTTSLHKQSWYLLFNMMLVIVVM